jgi:ABC-type uncharacterized transport system permease subunit
LIVELMQVAAALYLAAGLGLLAGGWLPHARPGRVAAILLAAGVVLHGLTFAGFHRLDPPVPLTDFPAAVSWMAWVGALFALLLLRRKQLELLVGAIAVLAFVAAMYGSLALGSGPSAAPVSGGWPHLHVVLAGGGLAALGVAGLAGCLFLLEDRALKRKRPVSAHWRRRLPSLEALDRVNLTSLAVGFPLLTVGVVAGMLWSQALSGRFWSGSHAHWAGLAWVVYLVLVAGRFGVGWSGRPAALSAAAGFAVLLLAVVGVEVAA